MKKQDVLTRKQKRVYDLIKGYLTDHGESPTIKELTVLLGLKSTRTTIQYLDSLERKGLLQRGRYQRRGIKLTEDEKPQTETISVPVFASAGCGSPSVIAERTFDEFASVSKDFAKGIMENLFVIRAVGNSMVDAGIRDNDMVLVEMTTDVRENDIVVAIIDDTAVIKKLNFANNAVILNPVTNDPAYRPIILRKDFQVFGKVIEVIKIERGEDYEIVEIPQER